MRGEVVIDPASFRSSVIDVNGQRLHIAETGQGPLVLLLHGFPESWYSWRHQLIALREAGYRAVAMSGRGYGRSSKPCGPAAYRITELVADCVGVVRALGGSKAVIVGHDWGAQVAWACAWTRPDVFRAVAALGVAFGGRTLLALPGYSEDETGPQRPSEVVRAIAGPGLVFYREYLATPGLAEREMDADVHGWLRDGYYSYSASACTYPATDALGAAGLDQDTTVKLLRDSAACIRPGAQWRDRFHSAPDTLPSWLGEDVLDFYTREFEYTGFVGALNWYRCPDLNWELLAPFATQEIRVPALYIAGDRDPATMWTTHAIDQMAKKVPELDTPVVLSDCGHWIGEERPTETNRALVEFLGKVADTTR
jgi:pimeloyl-ACP methyl ester carboxylesterase